jgi:hypothetical protein
LWANKNHAGTTEHLRSAPGTQLMPPPNQTADGFWVTVAISGRPAASDKSSRTPGGERVRRSNQLHEELEKNKRTDGCGVENHPSEEAKSEQSGESGRSTVTREEEEQDLTGRSLRANDTERGNQTADSEEHTRRRRRNRNQILSKSQSDVDA